MRSTAIRRRNAAAGPSSVLQQPVSDPVNKLSEFERRKVLEVLGSPRFVDLAPLQVFAQLLDEGTYLCSVGVDLALAMVEDDHGPDVARRVAQSLVVYMQRAGGQSQFSAALDGPTPRSALVRRAVDLICANPAHPHTVQTLATHARVSPRHLTRLFRTELERSPAEYVGFVRFCTARDLLHAGHSVTEAAVAAGYGNSEALRRAFIARLGISPRKYQQRFRTTGSTAALLSDDVELAVS